MFWLLIEGDNGTGKDTLRALFEQAGWQLNADSVAASAALDFARQSVGRDRITAYLDYCRYCTPKTATAECKTVTVRYWPSTLAGGYADGLLDRNELENLTASCIMDFPAPDGVVELRCSADVRINRIVRRVPEWPGAVDSIEPERARLHRLALEHIASCWNRPWLRLDTSLMSPTQVFNACVDWIKTQEGYLQ